MTSGASCAALSTKKQSNNRHVPICECIVNIEQGVGAPLQEGFQNVPHCGWVRYVRVGRVGGMGGCGGGLLREKNQTRDSRLLE